MHVALRLAKEGLFQGDPERVLAAPTDVVLSALGYVTFLAEYEETMMEMNREETR